MYVNALLNIHTSDRHVTHINKMLRVTIPILLGKGEGHSMICLCRHKGGGGIAPFIMFWFFGVHSNNTACMEMYTAIYFFNCLSNLSSDFSK